MKNIRDVSVEIRLLSILSY